MARTTVTTDMLKDAAVTTAKVNDLAVTAGKLAADAVTTAKILDANVTTDKIADDAVTRAKMSADGYATLDTMQTATGAETSLDFTLPAGTRKVTVLFAGLSTSGTSPPLIQLGDAGGIEATDYVGSGHREIAASASTGADYTTGFGLSSGSHSASDLLHGEVSLYLMDSATNLWVTSFVLGTTGATAVLRGGGKKALSAELTTVRITTAGGTEFFDAGSVNVQY